jgi:mono/diheme cytochrome c family protein
MGWRYYLITVGILVLGVLPQPGVAQEQEVAKAGRPLYEDNCMVCHGHAAKGDGPMVTFGLLTVPAPDLTEISKQNDGKFPFWRIYRIIDGREPVKGHGAPDMPIWGDEFRYDLAGSAMMQSQVRGRILALVYYLQSIQAK